MDLQTWVSIATMAVFAIALFTYLNKKFQTVDERFDKLDAKIDGVRDELKGDIGSRRTELKANIGKLDERVYGLATGRTQHPLIVPPH